MAETDRHLQLKALAIAWLRAHGCRVMATEVRCPLSKFRVDVAAYLDPLPAKPRPTSHITPLPPEPLRRQPGEPRTIAIECKQSRADFLRDRRDHDELLALRESLLRQRDHLALTRVKPNEPHLRREGSSLFEHDEAWDLSASTCRSYQNALTQLRQVERRLVSDTKFSTLDRYHLADRLLLLTPVGLIEPGELPAGWGLLEHWPGCDSVEQSLRLRVQPVEHRSILKHRHRLLRNIAASASLALVRGINRDEKTAGA
jgi:hypothetical protein